MIDNLEISRLHALAYLFRGLLFFEEKKYLQAEDDWKKVMVSDAAFGWLKEILRSVIPK